MAGKLFLQPKFSYLKNDLFPFLIADLRITFSYCSVNWRIRNVYAFMINPEKRSIYCQVWAYAFILWTASFPTSSQAKLQIVVLLTFICEDNAELLCDYVPMYEFWNHTLHILLPVFGMLSPLVSILDILVGTRRMLQS